MNKPSHTEDEQAATVALGTSPQTGIFSRPDQTRIGNSGRRLIALTLGLVAALPLAAATARPSGDWSMIAAARSAGGGWVKPAPFATDAVINQLLPASEAPAASAAPATGKARREPAGGPAKRADWFYRQRAYPLEQIPAGARQRALAQTEKVAEFRGRDKASSASPWTLVGPVGFNSRIEPTWGQMSGRVRAMAIDPTNSNRLLLGTATGGVWLSSDAGASWTALTDSQPSLAIGAVAIDPSNPNVFYAGTGEGNGSYYGVGILKSTDAGASWTVIGANEFNRGSIAGLAVSPDGNVVVACALAGNFLGASASPRGDVGGVYRSTDGGQTFTQTQNNFCSGLAVAGANFNIMYHSATGVGAANGLYKSTDGGATWTHLTSAVNGAEVERLAIGVSPDGNRVYIGGKVGGDVVLQNSSDGGSSWSTPLATTIPEEVNAASFQLYCEKQCGYDNAVAVNPFNLSDVFYAGVGSYRSTDGGATFTQVGANNTGGGPLHVDHHLVLFDPNSQGVIYSGNDGGIYRSADNGATWTSIGGTLATLQPYHVSLHPSNREILYTGNQDNGTTRRTDSNVWTEIGGGDGGYSAVNHANPQIVYSSATNLSLSKSDNGGETNNAAITQVPKEANEPVAFIAPFVMDPVNPEILYAGTSRLWRTADGAQTWTAISPALATNAEAYITQIAIARSDTSVIYTVASDGSVARSNAAGFAQINKAPLPGRYASAIAISPTDPNTAYVGFSGFNDTTPSTPGHIFKTTDAGASWTDVSANLPDVPVNALAINPGAADEIYAGTDTGVFISLDGGGSWARMTGGLPNAGVSTLAVNATTNLLVAGTYGRSVWRTDLSGSAPANANYTAIYYNPDNAGYGVAVTHQDNTVVAIWYTYNPDGRPTWYTAATTRQADGSYRGNYLLNTGTPLAQINGSPASTSNMPLGEVDLVFGANGQLDFGFTPTGAANQRRALQPLPLSASPLVCNFTSEPRTNATNFTDLWWNPNESGWGLSILNQGNLIFLAWYTYADDGQPQWLTSVLTRQADGSYSGRLNRTASGTPYTTAPMGNVTPFPVPEVGDVTLSFSNGETGTLGYVVDGVTQSKAIQRLVFGTQAQICQ
ncbi:MAG: hypothetical protein R3F18_02155 [Lysobacterales bacterium]